MNLTATASSIAASGGIRPDSHITARPVTARKAGPVALTLTGQRINTDERERPSKRFGLMQGSRRAASRSGGVRMGDRNLGNPCAEKVGACRPRQNKGAAPLTKAPSAFRRIGGAVRRGTLTITGSNVRLGTEMPAALSSLSL